MHISKELFDLLAAAREYSILTDGAFDITYASVGYLYDFRKHVHPDDAQIDKALPAVNYRHVLLDPKAGTVRFSQKGVRIDLGGIAKGYSVDRGIDVLKSSVSPGCTSPPAATAASSATASANHGWSASAIRARVRAK